MSIRLRSTRHSWRWVLMLGAVILLMASCASTGVTTTPAAGSSGTQTGSEPSSVAVDDAPAEAATAWATATPAPTESAVATPRPTFAPARPSGELAAPAANLLAASPRSVSLALVARLDNVLAMAVHAPTDSVFVGRQTGEIHRVARDGRDAWTVDPTPAFSLVDRTISNKERGLLGFAFSPTGEHLYVVWTDRDTNANVLTEYSVNADAEIDASSERLVLWIDQPYRNHNGGHVVFGPDGYLYYGLGDGGASGDPDGNGQNASSLLGAILRIDPLARDAGAYGIPPSNPFVSGGGAPENFIIGARNPWRFSFDRLTGDLWVADVGQDEFEEVNVLRAADGGGRGVNLGWNIREGAVPFRDGDSAGLTDPLFAYPHGSGGPCSVTGGFVYRGEQLPQLAGAYIYGDWCNGQVWALSQDGQTNLELDVNVGGRDLASFGETPDGELWILTDGTILALVPAT